MIEDLQGPDPSVLVKVARLDGLIRERKFRQAYELLDELKAEVPERFHTGRPTHSSPSRGPQEAA